MLPWGRRWGGTPLPGVWQGPQFLGQPPTIGGHGGGQGGPPGRGIFHPGIWPEGSNVPGGWPALTLSQSWPGACSLWGWGGALGGQFGSRLWWGAAPSALCLHVLGDSPLFSFLFLHEGKNKHLRMQASVADGAHVTRSGRRWGQGARREAGGPRARCPGRRRCVALGLTGPRLRGRGASGHTCESHHVSCVREWGLSPPRCGDHGNPEGTGKVTGGGQASESPAFGSEVPVGRPPGVGAHPGRLLSGWSPLCRPRGPWRPSARRADTRVPRHLGVALRLQGERVPRAPLP